MYCRTEETREEAWFVAFEHLSQKTSNNEMNVVIEILNPSKSNRLSKKIKAEFDSLLYQANQYSINTVAETIFPAYEYKKHGSKGVLEVYPDEIYPALKKLNANNRGTYAERILRGVNNKNQECRPLERCIERMKKELVNPSTKKSIYEISVGDVDQIPINRNDSSYIGFPCLSHLSFKLMKNDGKLHLTALYRTQFYTIKALGNLLGLARLQDFVAREIGVSVGTMVCHSTFAEMDTHHNLGKAKISNFIDNIKDYMNGSD